MTRFSKYHESARLSPSCYHAAWGEQGRERMHRPQLDEACGCASACRVHGHDHSRAWTGIVPVHDLKSFWGALGCSCFAF